MSFDVRCHFRKDMTQECCDCILNHFLFVGFESLPEIVSESSCESFQIFSSLLISPSSRIPKSLQCGHQQRSQTIWNL